jgi:hypothetical protein
MYSPNDCRRVVAAESLERRLLFSLVEWVGGSTGNWNTGSNWSGGAVPGMNDDVRINPSSGQVVVTLNAGTHTIKSLDAQSTSLRVAATLTILNGGTLDGELRLSSGTLTTATSSGAKLLLGALALFEMSGGILKGNLELSFLNAFHWTGGEMASPGTTTVGDFADPYNYIEGTTGTPVLSRPLVYRGRDLSVRGNLTMNDGLLDFRAGSYFLSLNNANILGGTGQNLVRTVGGFINALGESRIEVPADIDGQVGLGSAGVLHLLASGTAALDVADGGELHVRGNGYVLDVNSAGLTSRGDIYFEGGTHTVETMAHEGDVYVDGAATQIAFAEHARAELFRITNGAQVNFNESATVQTFRITSGAAAHLNGNGSNALVTKALFVVGDASLDIGRNSVVIDYDGITPLTSIRPLLVGGYAGGEWTGAGISSSGARAKPGHAVGYAEASAIFSSFPATFAGVQVDSTALLLTYTRYGDANLDRTVNLQDFNILATNFGGAVSEWWQGNFNFDSSINLLDFNRLASHFGHSADMLGELR